MDTGTTSDSNDGTPDRPTPVSSTIDVTDREDIARKGNSARSLVIAMAIGLLVVVALQVFALMSSSRTGEQITALDDQIESLNHQVGTIGSDVSSLQGSVAAVDQKVDDLGKESLVAPAASGASAATAPAEPAGVLPPFEQGQPDAALGVALGDVTGHEYYTGDEVTFDPGDGVARAWLIWAHWCPHCQREMPAVSEWYRENADAYPNVELVSITSSIDPNRGNPLEPYLDELQTPFPVLVDDDLSLAEQFGLNAFPFWVFTSGDGTTVLRVAGYLEVDQVADVFAQLNAIQE
jgi:thiol-disulfide isomerase/thioredoxin